MDAAGIVSDEAIALFSSDPRIAAVYLHGSWPGARRGPIATLI